jgi:4-amino-4-deoxy-L-arabinose transferase-like glycosyltransferase
MSMLRAFLGPAFAWTALVAAALWARPLMPVDETRYLSVAWEMWQRGDWLVPHLNGAPYHHKPPLLFWLIQIGWHVFGVSELWGRLVAPLFGLGNLALTIALGRRLWPHRPEVAVAAPWLLVGGFWWAGYTTLTMFDMLVVSFALVGLLGLVVAWQSQRLLGWALFALGVAGGVLSKGPVILVFLLPAALFAPWWMTRDRPGWPAWYGSVLLALLAGAGLALAWALPAAQAGGTEYGNAILWGQTGGRVVKSFAHRREVWFYLAALPAMLLPWAIWPALWRGTWAAWRNRRQSGPSAGARFCAIAVIVAVLIMSVVSGKQPQYLLPLLPLLALAMAAAVVAIPAAGWADRWLPPLIAGLAGLGLIGAIAATRAGWWPAGRGGAPDWLDDMSIGLGIGLVAAAVMAGVQARRNAVTAFATLSVVSLMILHLGARPVVRPYFDLSAVAGRLAGLERDGRPIAMAGEYHGQFNFLGRLTRPVAVVPRTELAAWLAAHPNGVVIQVETAEQTPAPLYRQVYRGRALAIRDAASFNSPG